MLDMNPTAIDSPKVNANKRGHFISDDCRILSDSSVIHHAIVDMSSPSKGTNNQQASTTVRFEYEQLFNWVEMVEA